MIEFLKKIFLILDSNNKKKLGTLFCLIIIGMLFETLGIGMIIPAVTIIINPEVLNQYAIEGQIFQYIKNLSNFNLMILGISAITLLYFIKTIFLVYLVWYKNNFSYNVLAELSKTLFKKYLNRDWSEFLNSTSSKLIRNCNSEPTIFANSVVMPIIELIAEATVLIGILTLLILIEPIVTVINCIIFFLFILLYHKFFKNKALELGRLRQQLELTKIKHLQHGFSALRDIKILNRENYFLDKFNFPNKKSAQVLIKWTTIQTLPRLLLELVAVLCLTAVIIILIFQNTNLNQIIPSLAMFGAASMRLLPSSNRILNALQNLRYGKASIDLIQNELMNIKNTKEQKVSKRIVFNNSINLKNINFNYEAEKNLIIKNVNMEIFKGSFVGIIGESGSGKSTIIDIILGLLKPSSGVVEVDGKKIKDKLRRWQKLIGYVPQDIYLIDDTLKQNIAFGVQKDKIDNKKILKAIKYSQLESFVSSLDNGLDTLFGERGIKLSGGQLQRIAIARALYSDPEILILDEATSALDNETESYVMNAVRKLKGFKTIIIIAHRFSTIKDCDYLYKLNKGEIIDKGIPAELLERH